MSEHAPVSKEIRGLVEHPQNIVRVQDEFKMNLR
jgi:hypothetical protein